MVKTPYSIGTATADLKKGIEKSKELGKTSLVLVDDNFCAAVPFYNACTKAEIKPILGLEIIVDGVKLTIISKNNNGYKYLIEKYSTEMTLQSLVNKDLEVIISDFDTTTNLQKALNTFPNGYIGIFPYKDPDLYIKARHLYSNKGSRKVIIMDIPLHLEEGDYRNTISIRAILNKTSFNKENILYDNFFYRKTEGNPEWIQNLEDLKDSCINDYEFGEPTAPSFAFTKEVAIEEGLSENTTDEDLFIHLSRKGLDKRLLDIPEEKHQEYKDRLEVEIDIINIMGFPGYMLIVWEFIAAARSMNIPVGPGRGSAAGSLVAFSLEITDIDPLPYGLLFERFLNPERITMPDIDVDFAQSRREDVLNYVSEKYGQDKVAHIITFTKFAPRGTIRDVSRIHGYNLFDTDFFAKTIPDTPGTSFEDAYEAKRSEIDAIITDPLPLKVWNNSMGLEGLIRGNGLHASAIAIDSEPIYKKGSVVTIRGKKVLEAEGAYAEEVKLIKFDFLGLKTLDVIDNSVKMAERNNNKSIDIKSIDLNDKEIFKQIQEGHTHGLFQIESDGMQDLAKRLKPDCFEDVIAMLALYRPGPMESGMLDDFIERKQGRAKITYMFPELEEILKPTYGVIVYQEQVMQIVQTIGGFSLGGADMVRRGMGKKDQALLDRLKTEFVEGAIKNGFPEQKSGDLFDLILKFAGYGFNKSHSAAYALLTVYTAHLKHYYPAEFMSSIMKYNKDKIAKYLQASRQMGLTVLNPDINTSRVDFETDDGQTIFYSISSLKGVGKGAGKVIKEREKNGLFDQVDGHTGRYEKISGATFKALVNSGGFDHISPVRKPLLEKDATEDYTLTEKLDIELDVLGYFLSDPFERLTDYLSPYYIPTIDDLEEGKNSVLVFPQELVSRTAKKSGKTFAILTAFFFGGEVKEVPAFNDSVSKLSIIDMKDPRPFILKVSKKGDSLFLNDVIALGKQALENNFMKV